MIVTIHVDTAAQIPAAEICQDHAMALADIKINSFQSAKLFYQILLTRASLVHVQAWFDLCIDIENIAVRNS